MERHQMATTTQVEVPLELLDALRSSVRVERFLRRWPFIAAYLWLGATAGLAALGFRVWELLRR